MEDNSVKMKQGNVQAENDFNEGLSMRKPGSLGEVGCCPELELDKACSRLTFAYRLTNRVVVTVGDRRQIPVDVQVIVRAELERCPGPPVLGDIVYTTTLLPMEKVRIFTHDRRSRFSYDADSKVSYRHEQASEEHYFMGSMSRFMSDLSITEGGRITSESHSDWRYETDTPGVLGVVFGGADVEVSGSHNANSTRDFARELTQHAESSTERSLEATRTASSVSVGEVSTHFHAEGESEAHFESSSRVFSNSNECHAVTYLFYRINKTQTIRFRIVAIDRKVIDVAAPTTATANPLGVTGRLAVMPDAVRAAADNRLEVEAREQQSQQNRMMPSYTLAAMPRMASVNVAAASATAAPIDAAVRAEALKTADEGLVEAGLIDKVGGNISAEAKKELFLELHTSLPTPGIYVRGCIDECSTCEPRLLAKKKLELERIKLDNRLLERQIELLDKAQEYRCCPGESNEAEEPSG
jgi:hypothetical protein